MFCPKCGNEIQDGMRFCQKCGSPVPAARPVAAGAAQQRPAGAPMQQQRPSGPVLHTIRKLAASPLYLTGAIAYSCALLFSIAATVSGSNSLTATIMRVLSLMGSMGGMGSMEMNYLNNELMGALSGVQGMFVGTAILGQLPAILIAVGIWITFASAVNKSGAPMSTGGLTIIKVITIINLVFQCLALLVCEIVMLILMGALGQYDDAVVPIVIVFMVLIAVIFAFSIVFYAKLSGTISAMQQSIRTETASDRVSSYVAVIAMISGIFSVFSLLGFGGLFLALSSLGSAVAAISFSLFLFRYKKEMRMLMAGYDPRSAGGNTPAEYSPMGYGNPVDSAPQSMNYGNPVDSAPQSMNYGSPVEPAPQSMNYGSPVEPAPQSMNYDNPVDPVQPASYETPIEPVAAMNQQPAMPAQPGQNFYYEEPVSAQAYVPTVPIAETTVLNARQETTVLNAGMMLPTLRLIRIRDNSVITVDRPQFRIGRDPGVADYIVADNTAVGRQHADIVMHDGNCYVIDLNSTNHTYVNGQQIVSGMEYPIQNGDEIMLGDDCFRVEISGGY